jgi:hypothetical protein
LNWDMISPLGLKTMHLQAQDLRLQWVYFEIQCSTANKQHVFWVANWTQL